MCMCVSKLFITLFRLVRNSVIDKKLNVFISAEDMQIEFLLYTLSPIFINISSKLEERAQYLPVKAPSVKVEDMTSFSIAMHFY